MNDIFRVTWNRQEDTYTLIQEGITLNEEQARQIATAYNARNDNPYTGGIDKLPKLEDWTMPEETEWRR